MAYFDLLWGTSDLRSNQESLGAPPVVGVFDRFLNLKTMAEICNLSICLNLHMITVTGGTFCLVRAETKSALIFSTVSFLVPEVFGLFDFGRLTIPFTFQSEEMIDEITWHI